MTYRIQGTLKLPDGAPAANCEIEFVSRKNFSPLVQGAKTNILTSATGAYDVTLELGEYAVIVYTGGTYPAQVGTILISADTVAGQDLPSLLQHDGWAPATPDYVQQIENWVASASHSATSAEASAGDAADSAASTAGAIAAHKIESDAHAIEKITGLRGELDILSLHLNYSQIRAYTGTATRIHCLGRENSLDGASGDFVLDATDTTSPDNDITILVDANGGRWKRQYSGRAFGEWAGIKADDSTADDAALKKLLTFACAGNPVSLVSKPGVVRLSAPVLAALQDNKFVDIDFNGAVIKPVDGYVAGTSDKIVQLNGGSSLLSGCSVHIANPQFDSSNITPVNATTLAARKGIGGLLIQAAHTVKIENSRAKGQFYAASIFVNIYNRLDINGHYGVDCGVKYNATVDDTSTGDAAGDAIYASGAVGAAQVSMRNVSSSGQSGLIGRAGFVSEYGNNATSIIVTMENVSFDGYQRITHQEDGGKSTITWKGGSAKRFSCCTFNLGSTSGTPCVLDGVNVVIDPPFAYGGTAGLQNFQTSGEGVYSNCAITYNTAAIQDRGSYKVIGGSIALGASTVTHVTNGFVEYSDVKQFTSSGGSINASAGTLLLISNGTKLPNNITVSASGSSCGVEISDSDCGAAHLRFENIRQRPAKISNSKLAPTTELFAGSFNSLINIHNSIVKNTSTTNIVGVYGDGSVDVNYYSCDLTNIKPTAINGGGESDSTDVLRISGCTIRAIGSIAGQSFLNTYNPAIIVQGTTFIDKTTAQGMTIPSTSGNMVTTGVGNVKVTNTATTIL